MKQLLILFMCLFVAFTSCKTGKELPPESSKTVATITIKEVLHDTIYQVQADSSSYRALLECKKNKPVLKNDKSSPGKNLSKPKVNIVDNILEVDCESKAYELFAQWKSEHKTETITITNTEYIEIEKKLNWWQRWHMRLGKIFIGVLVGGLVYGFFKLKNIFL